MLFNHSHSALIPTGGRVTGGDEPLVALPSDCCRHATVLQPARDHTSLQAVIGCMFDLYIRTSLYVETPIHDGCSFGLVT